MAQVLTVSELNRLARVTLERGIPLCWVSGEVSNLTRAASGHVYFTLKDEAAQARCVMFRSRAQLLPWKLENGQQVEAQALVGLYEPRGDFQLNVEALRRGGLGRLFEAYARLKEQLEREGLFAPERKRPLPIYPRAIGVVTSLQAAALRDVLAALKRRAPHVPVMLYPTPVQGEGAGAKIAAAIAAADQRAECDVLIVARGGGSIEDLWAFNEEVVARAIVVASMPVVSGVGHETDVTIADFAADLRAATPTAAAELASAGWYAAAGESADLARRLRDAMDWQLNQRAQRLDWLQRRLVHPAQRLAQSRQHLAHLGTRLSAASRALLRGTEQQLANLRLRLSRQRPDTASAAARLARLGQGLDNAIHSRLQQRQGTLERLAASLAALNPEATLARGYSIVRDEAGKVVSSAGQLAPGVGVRLQFACGSAHGHIDSVETHQDAPHAEDTLKGH
ncbi:MAG: exodeoxyribonuclease VII large subunit [Rhodocyclaceae bacterium]|nr:MAG: exodeoxyribonuclease VII large subunit [Rhodocyclaceae bacterium]